MKYVLTVAAIAIFTIFVASKIFSGAEQGLKNFQQKYATATAGVTQN